MKRFVRAVALVLVVVCLVSVPALGAESDDIISAQWKTITDSSFYVDELNGVKAYPLNQCNDLPIRYYEEVYGIDIFVGVYSPFLMDNSFDVMFSTEIEDYGEIPDSISGFVKADEPKQGDIVYWSMTRRNKDYAHSALVKSYSDGVITLIEQNWNSNGKAVYERKIRYPSDNYVVYTLPDEALSGATGNAAGDSVDGGAAGTTANSVSVSVSTHAVQVDGSNVAISGYNIGGNNYFKLRDLAYVLRNTLAEFSVWYDETTKAISLSSNSLYVPVGGEMEAGEPQSQGVPSSSKMYIDGIEYDLEAYNIGGNNYFKLRDLGEALNFFVGYDPNSRTVIIMSMFQYSDEQ